MSTIVEGVGTKELDIVHLATNYNMYHFCGEKRERGLSECVSECVYERERERESVCVCVCVWGGKSNHLTDLSHDWEAEHRLVSVKKASMEKEKWKEICFYLFIICSKEQGEDTCRLDIWCLKVTSSSSLLSRTKTSSGDLSLFRTSLFG